MFNFGAPAQPSSSDANVRFFEIIILASFLGLSRSLRASQID
jgi:hypothetical protein